MNFYDYLYDNDLGYLINKVGYTAPTFHQEKEVYQVLLDAKTNNDKILIVGDYDVDGLCGLKIVEDSLLALEYPKVTTYKYTKRTHNLAPEVVNYAITNKFKVVIIIDTGSQDVSLIKRLTKYGIKVIVLDHHNTKTNYNKFPTKAFINTVIENELNKNDNFKLSAGALAFCVMQKFFTIMEVESPPSIYVYALISLYADSMDMTNQLNRSIYYKTKEIDFNDLPTRIQLIMDKTKKLTRRAIEYTIAPIINAAFRAEIFEPINKFFLDRDIKSSDLAEYCDILKEIRNKSRVMIETISDFIKTVGVEELDHFVLFDLKKLTSITNLDISNLKNYTGLIANDLFSKYRRTAVVICSDPKSSEVKGSLRDQLGRNYLTLFQQFCESGGHNSAFGIKLRPFEVESCKETIRLIDKSFPITGIQNTPVVLAVNNPDTSLVFDIATYNEFSGSGNAPMFMIKVKLSQDVSYRRTTYNYVYRWGQCIIDSDFILPYERDVYCKPIYSNQVKLKVQGL